MSRKDDLGLGRSIVRCDGTIVRRRLSLPIRALVLVSTSWAVTSCGGGGGGDGGNGGGVGSSSFTVGGTVSGLAGNVTILLNGGSALTVSANGAFAFTGALNSGSAYTVSVGTQPPGQTCGVTNGTGSVANANVSNVAIACTNNGPPTYSVGGNVVGLSGSLSIELNGGGAITVSSNGAYTFPNRLLAGSDYVVVVRALPSGQNCSIARPIGRIADSNVTNVDISCSAGTPAYVVGGFVSGLAGSLTLQLNSANALTITRDGAYLFPVPLANGTNYAVTVSGQPAGQSCAIANGNGTIASASVSNINVSCSTTAPPTLSLAATPQRVPIGGTSSLTWTTERASSCTASGGWTGSRSASGTETTPAIAGPTSYTLSCTGPGGQIASTVVVDTFPIPSATLTAEPNQVASGGRSVLRWSSRDATACEATSMPASLWSGSRPTSGEITIDPILESSAFQIRCTGPGGFANAFATVNVIPKPTVVLSSLTPEVGRGQAAMISWRTLNATACVASNDWSGSKGLSGDERVAFTQREGLFTLACDGPGGTTTQSVTVARSLFCKIPILSFDLAPRRVSAGGTTTLSWYSTEADNCSASQGWSGTKPLFGSETSAPINGDTQFALSCVGLGGQTTYSRLAGLNGSNAILPYVYLQSKYRDIVPGAVGADLELAWTSSGVTSCTASGGWSGARSVSGGEFLRPVTQPTAFTLSCTGPGGTASSEVQVGIAPNGNPAPVVRPDVISVPEGAQFQRIDLASAYFGNDDDTDGCLVGYTYGGKSDYDFARWATGYFGANETMWFRATEDLSGDLTEIYSLQDNTGQQSPFTTATFRIEPADDLPVLGDDHVSLRAGTASVTVPLTLNDRGLDYPYSLNIVRPPANGSVSLSISVGIATDVWYDQRAVYRPSAGFVGQDSFEYSVVDGDGDRATATVTIDVLSARCQADGTLTSPLGSAFGGQWRAVQFPDTQPATGQARDARGGPFARDQGTETTFVLGDLDDMYRETPIYAMQCGTVVSVQDFFSDAVPDDPPIFGSFCGNEIVVERSNGTRDRYCNLRLASPAVRVGDEVVEGQYIGRAGASAGYPGLRLSILPPVGAALDPLVATGAFAIDYPSTPAILSFGVTGSDDPRGAVNAAFLRPESRQRIVPRSAPVFWYRAYGLPSNALRLISVRDASGLTVWEGASAASPAGAGVFAYVAETTQVLAAGQRPPRLPVGAYSATLAFPDYAGLSSTIQFRVDDNVDPRSTVPRVLNLTRAEASASIAAAGLVTGSITERSSGRVPLGSVISQEPAANQSVVSGSAVGLVISSGPAPVIVPSLNGLTQAAASTRLQVAGLTVGVVSQQSSGTIPAGSIVEQSPAADVSVPRGSAVNLVVSSGPAIRPIPNVIGLAQSDATTAITAAGFTLGTSSARGSGTVAAGLVIEQSPAPGVPLLQGSAISIVVSLGPIQVAVPDVVGQSQANAVSMLVQSGLQVGSVSFLPSSTALAGTVSQQTVGAGSQVSAGTPVGLVVSTGPQPVSSLPGASDQLASGAAFDLVAGSAVRGTNVLSLPNGQMVAERVVVLSLRQSATVGQVNTLLGNTAAQIVGMQEDTGLMVLLIPTPASTIALQSTIDSIRAYPFVETATFGYLASTSALPSGFSASSEAGLARVVTALGAQLSSRASALWNVRSLYQTGDAPTLVVADCFGEGPPLDGIQSFDIERLNLQDFATGDQGVNCEGHGYAVLGMVAGSFGGGDGGSGAVTGVVGGRTRLRGVDYFDWYVTDGTRTFAVPALANLQLRARLRQIPGRIVLNTSIQNGSLVVDAVEQESLALQWLRILRGDSDYYAGRESELEQRVLHVTAAGNFSGRAVENSQFAAAGNLLGLIASNGVAVPAQRNVLVVESRDLVTLNGAPSPTCALASSSSTADGSGGVSAVGRIYSFSDTGTSARAFPDVTTSWATPIVAGGATWLWSVRPSFTAAQISNILQLSARDYCEGTQNSLTNGEPVLDMFAASLRLDVGSSPAQWLVRRELLNVNGSALDDSDRYEIAQRLFGIAAEPSRPDYSRFDLNGDGFTSFTRTAPFDLDADGNIDTQPVGLTYEGAEIEFSELEVSDVDVFCYYGLTATTPWPRANITASCLTPVRAEITVGSSLEGWAGLPTSAGQPIVVRSLVGPYPFYVGSNPAQCSSGELGPPTWSSSVPRPAEFWIANVTDAVPYNSILPNARPCSSFIAIRNRIASDANGRSLQEVWINATAKGRRTTNTGATTEKEYQLRYYSGVPGQPQSARAEIGDVLNGGSYIKAADLADFTVKIIYAPPRQ